MKITEKAQCKIVYQVVLDNDDRMFLIDTGWELKDIIEMGFSKMREREGLTKEQA